MAGRGGAAPAAAAPMGGSGISGDLPWGAGGAGALSGDPASAYASAYNSSLAMNKQNYSNILQGYNQTMQQQQSAQQGITAGYGQLTGDVMGLIAGTDTAQRQAIADQYQANRGQASQSLIDRGLGNTTVQSSVDRGLQYDRSKSEINLSNQFAQLNAQYRTQLGLSGLDYQNQANMQNTALASQQLGWMNSANFKYPDASMYMQLAQMKGANKAGGLGGVGPMGGGAVTWDKQPTPAAGPQAAQYYGASSYGGGGYGNQPRYGGGQASPSEIYPSSMGNGESSGIGYGQSAADDAFWASPSGADMGGSFSTDYGTFQQPTENQAGGVVSLGDGGYDDYYDE